MTELPFSPTPMLLSRRAALAGLATTVGALAVGCGRIGPQEGTTPDPPPTTDAPYVPGADWETVAAADLGWDPVALEAVLAFAGSRSTKAMVLVADGKLLAERYYGVSNDYQREIASCQKSVVSLLVGVAAERGLLALNDPVSRYLGPDWTNSPADDVASITVRNLLSMTSGLDKERRVVAPPGEVWSYNNDAYHQLQPVLEAASGRGIAELSAEWLWAPIGATSGTWYPRSGTGVYAADAKGQPLWGLRMSARDMARVGLLVERRGSWDDRAVVPGEYLDDALRSSSSINPSYGLLWWLNGQDGYRIGPAGPLQRGPLVPDAPADMVAALGKDDQKIYVSRASQLVVVRQGDRAGTRSAESLSDFDNELWRLIAAAQP